MTAHIEKGKAGERLAVHFLRERDFTVIARNWRHRHYEIDIIATKDAVVHFVEVKTRHNLTFGYPEEGVTKRKFRSLKKGAEYFMQHYPFWKRLQFDILAISRSSGQKEQFLFIEDVYL